MYEIAQRGDWHRKYLDYRMLSEGLRVLGNAALDEYAEWILMHRERPLERSKL